MKLEKGDSREEVNTRAALICLRWPRHRRRAIAPCCVLSALSSLSPLHVPGQQQQQQQQHHHHHQQHQQQPPPPSLQHPQSAARHGSTSAQFPSQVPSPRSHPTPSSTQGASPSMRPTPAPMYGSPAAMPPPPPSNLQPQQHTSPFPMHMHGPSGQEIARPDSSASARSARASPAGRPPPRTQSSTDSLGHDRPRLHVAIPPEGSPGDHTQPGLVTAGGASLLGAGFSTRGANLRAVAATKDGVQGEGATEAEASPDNLLSPELL